MATARLLMPHSIADSRHYGKAIACQDTRDIAETLVSFANADGGELIVGMEDDGEVTGIPHEVTEISVMTKAPQTHVHQDTPLPPPRMFNLAILKGSAAGKRILYFSVPKGTEHVYLTSDGRCLQRHDRETRPVPAERIQWDRRERVSLEYDRQFVDGATTADLDLTLLDKVVKTINPSISREKMLQFFDIAEYEPLGLRLRRAALLLFANDISQWHPRSQVRVLRVAGTTMGVGKEYNVSKDDTVQGNILQILAQAWDVLRPHLAVQRLGSEGRFQETLIYPEEACMEALVNAIGHRDYSIEGRGIEVLVFDDRLEIVSPGGLLSSITVEDLKQLKKVHQSRNAYVARVLRDLGYMREMGEGIPRIFKAMEERDIVPPDIWSNADTFTIALFHRSVFSPKDQQWLDSLAQFRLSRDEQRIVLLGKDGHLMTPREIRDTLGIVDTEDYRKVVESLLRKGLIYTVRAGSQLKQTIRARERRDVGRFALRPIGELQHFYNELTEVLETSVPTQHFNVVLAMEALRRLSPKNPYCKTVVEMMQSLRYLEFIDAQSKPLKALETLWSQPRKRR